MHCHRNTVKFVRFRLWKSKEVGEAGCSLYLLGLDFGSLGLAVLYGEVCLSFPLPYHRDTTTLFCVTRYRLPTSHDWCGLPSSWLVYLLFHLYFLFSFRITFYPRSEHVLSKSEAVVRLFEGGLSRMLLDWSLHWWCMSWIWYTSSSNTIYSQRS